MKRRSLAALCLLLCVGLAAASAEPAGMRILDWLKAEAGINVAKPRSKPASIDIAAVGDATPLGGHSHGHGGYYGMEELCLKENVRCGTSKYYTAITGLGGVDTTAISFVRYYT